MPTDASEDSGSYGRMLERALVGHEPPNIEAAGSKP